MPASRTSAIQPDQFGTFGQLLRFLRQRAGLTQRELSIAVGYSESQISRLEQNQRAPDHAALAARFLPALHVDKEPNWAARLLELGAASHAEGQPDEPAPAADIPLSPHNLPAQLTSFIGRERELAEIKQLLAPDFSDMGGEVRLLTLTGHGGTGKTRLALQAATALLMSFTDGVWWVELAPLTDPALIPQAVTSVLGLKEEPDRPLLATLINHLHGKRALLILDNCEHLIQASAQFADAVLRGCPHVRLLASSREMLGVAGERALVVPSLLTPEPRAALSVDAMRNYDAVRLFVARASTTAPHFTLTAENASAVVQVCWRLDGIPLALELAAARLRMLPVEELAARLDDAFRLLTGGSRMALPRHQTLQALIDWSYEMLPDAEQKLLRRLAVFSGGWTLAAAEAVCAGDGLESNAVAGLLGRLIDKSLVLVEEQAGAARYRLMETIRQYAQAKLAASGAADEARGQHATFYLAFAEADAPALTGRLQPAWLDRMEREHDNLRVALGWCQSAPDRAELGLRLTGQLAWLWYSHGYWGYSREARGWLEGALAQPGVANYPHEQALALVTLGNILGFQGDYVSAQAHFAHSLRLFQELGDRLNSAWALDRLGWVARERGDGPTARARSEESLALYRELGDNSGICLSTNTLAEAMSMQGDLVAAKALLAENLRLARQLEDTNAIGWSLNHLGHIAQLERKYTEATRLHQASLQPFHQLGARNEGHVWAHQSLGETYLAQGDAPLAASHFAEALVTARDLGEPAGTAWCLAGLAGAAAVNEEPERAAWLWAAAEALRRSLGVREAPASHDTHERLKAVAQEQIGQAAFAEHWAAGEVVSASEAIERALRSEPEI
jgi:predicted ATPase/transcriptional regulator with XRE-family HTH domain